MANESIKKTAAVIAGATLAAGNMAQAVPEVVATSTPAVQSVKQEANTGFWNGVKKVVGLPYQETEYWDENNEQGVKSTGERALWGLWTYKEDTYDKMGNREETRYYKGNKEVKRDEFHSTGEKSWTGDMKDGHPVGRVRTFDEMGRLTSEGNYDQEGRADGVHKQMKGNVLVHETTYSHGKRQGEERVYNPNTGSLQKTIPWDNDKKNGVEHNVENGDFTTYRDNIRDGGFRETTKTRDGYGEGSIERSGTYTNGKMCITKERELNSEGKLKRETTYDENGEKHGEERIANGIDFDVNPYSHGRLNGRQIKSGGSFTTWKDGIPEGPYRSTSSLAVNDDMQPVVNVTEEGNYNNGEKTVKSKRYFKFSASSDGAFGSFPVTEEEAYREAALVMGEPKGMKSMLKKSSDRSTMPKVSEPAPAQATTKDSTSEKKPALDQKALASKLAPSR